jgi:hypothetical protein
MNFRVPEQYVITKFFQYTGFPVYKPGIKAYNACCPICREGNSWGRKKRLFYFPKKEQLYCHNCNKGWSPLGWIKQVCGLSYKDIRAEINSGYSGKPVLDVNSIVDTKPSRNIPSLPLDSINLFDKNQVKFYKSNPVVRRCLQIIKQRRLSRAINKPIALYVSLNDFIHKNRLCIPFYDINNNITFYQTRRILDDNSPKYLSKQYSDKTVFGLNSIDVDFPYIFVVEGPIDAMFVKNGVAVCGTSMTKLQLKQLQQFPAHEIIWCLDNQHVDATSKKKTLEILSEGYKVFIWPDNILYKDFNKYCTMNNINEFDYNIILNNSNTNTVSALLSSIKF